MTWHVDPIAMRAYASGTAPDSVAWSVETHITQCGTCLSTLSHYLTDGDRALLATSRASIRLDQHRVAGRSETFRFPGALSRRPWPAVRAGVLGPWWAWVGFAVLATILLSVASRLPAWRADADVHTTGLVMLSPVVPVALVAVVYAVADRDPTGESTPRGGLELVLIRAASVLVMTLPLVTLVRAVHGIPSAAWLLPGLGLCMASLAIGTWIGVERAAGGMTAGWVALSVVAMARITQWSPPKALTVPTLAEPLWWLLLMGSVAVLLWRRNRFDIATTHRMRLS